MIPRLLTTTIQEIKKYFPIVYLGGPRQSGKTTLLKHLFPDMPYASLENPDVRLLAERDPRRFLDAFSSGAILDEAQRVPDLFSYLQGIVDANKNLRFILSGSQNFLLMEKITQSLAGRVGILTLLPFSLDELPAAVSSTMDPEKWAWQGGYPAIYDRQAPPGLVFPNYVETYLQRDVRQMRQVGDLARFDRFLRLCAGRAGQLLNMSALANDADISVNTAKDWLSILEASYVLFFLQPYHENYNKRLVKTPKIYFFDTGLLCYLLGIHALEQLNTHFAYGNILENMLIAELYKKRTHRGARAPFWFWRDNHGNEVDLIIEDAGALRAVELKAAKTFNTRLFQGLSRWQKTSGQSAGQSAVVYLGNQRFQTDHGTLLPWTEAIFDPNF
ncbi:MAG: ATP-binding protein [Saprospirales bacterium]|nr:ATP-binding protein [Saprospirales bacterium]